MTTVSHTTCPINIIYECGALKSDGLVIFEYQFDFSEQFKLAQGQIVALLAIEPTRAQQRINVTCVADDEAIQMRFEYSAQWFSIETMRTFVDEFVVLLSVPLVIRQV